MFFKKGDKDWDTPIKVKGAVQQSLPIMGSSGLGGGAVGGSLEKYYITKLFDVNPIGSDTEGRFLTFDEDSGKFKFVYRVNDSGTSGTDVWTAEKIITYVEDNGGGGIEEYPDYASLPVVGESGILYITTDDENRYRWSDTTEEYINTTDPDLVPYLGADRNVDITGYDLIADNGIFSEEVVTPTTYIKKIVGDCPERSWRTFAKIVNPYGGLPIDTFSEFDINIEGRANVRMTIGMNQQTSSKPITKLLNKTYISGTCKINDIRLYNHTVTSGMDSFELQLYIDNTDEGSEIFEVTAKLLNGSDDWEMADFTELPSGIGLTFNHRMDMEDLMFDVSLTDGNHLLPIAQDGIVANPLPFSELSDIWFWNEKSHGNISIGRSYDIGQTKEDNIIIGNNSIASGDYNCVVIGGEGTNTNSASMLLSSPWVKLDEDSWLTVGNWQTDDFESAMTNKSFILEQYNGVSASMKLMFWWGNDGTGQYDLGVSSDRYLKMAYGDDQLLGYNGLNIDNSNNFGIGMLPTGDHKLEVYGGVYTDYIEYNTSYVPTGSEATGTSFWDTANKTMSTVLENGVTLQHGEEGLFPVQNDTGVTIDNGQLCTYASSIGNSGNIRVSLTVASASEPPIMTIGVATSDILDVDTGKVTTRGKVRGIQTDGDSYGETWNDAEILYKSSTIAGGLTNVAPEAPIPAIPIAVVISAHGSNGTLFVRPSFPSSLADLTDVNGTATTTNGQMLIWDNDNSYFDFTHNINDYLPNTHLTDFVHGDIAHANRSDLDLVSGSNTGDQSGLTLSIDTTFFSHILTSAENTAQKAFDKLDDNAVKKATSSTDNAIPRFDGVVGNDLQNSDFYITDDKELVLPIVFDPSADTSQNSIW